MGASAVPALMFAWLHPSFPPLISSLKYKSYSITGSTPGTCPDHWDPGCLPAQDTVFNAALGVTCKRSSPGLWLPALVGLSALMELTQRAWGLS